MKKHLKKLSKVNGEDLFNLLPLETRKGIREISEKEWIDFTKKVREKGWKRKKHLVQGRLLIKSSLQ